jgi:rhodanese-related sulfurtransferase
MASPLAGSMRMPFFIWMRLDLAAALMYALTYGLTGFIFGESIGKVLKGVHALGTIMEWVTIAAITGYVLYRLWLAWKNRIYRVVPQISVDALQARMSEADVVLADVRSHGYYDRGASRIRGSLRIEPNNITEAMHQLPKDKDIYLYCT